jgi:transcriptional regulator with XRE-family HTH domain
MDEPSKAPRTTEPMWLCLKQIRMSAGLSQEGLAQRANLPFHSVARIEAGNAPPSPEAIQRLAAALQIDPLRFVGLTDADDLCEAFGRLIAGLDPPAAVAAFARAQRIIQRTIQEWEAQK